VEFYGDVQVHAFHLLFLSLADLTHLLSRR
jgi:hypothetical protein